MADRGFEAALEPEARRLRDLLPEEDQEEIDAIIRAIEDNPYPDGLITHLLDSDPFLTVVYRHPRWWVLYRFVEPGHIAIDAIAPPLLPPGSDIY